ncbi:hypothetical protein HMPREF1557_02064 [Streptococcus sobrinus W1703]|uniref:Uncharacterized protein n=1 Tax=Streptococcus sobrinus W1703 TaxID=1227275 RepID=U2J1A8_9STRE|nr:hypothetical protein HMPREF1557_02064 [Streptococcus sobrinus W1703]
MTRAQIRERIRLVLSFMLWCLKKKVKFLQRVLIHVLIGIVGGWLISLFIAYLFNNITLLHFFVAPTKYIKI